MASAKITEQAIQMVRDADEADAIIIPVLRGTLPAEASRTEVDIPRIRAAAQKALLVHPIVQLKETAVSDEVVRSIFEGEFKDLKTKAYEYFVQIFADRYGKEEAQKLAHGALNLIEPLSTQSRMRKSSKPSRSCPNENRRRRARKHPQPHQIHRALHAWL